MVTLPAAVALARPVGSLTPAGVKDPVWEPKWDGYRALTGAGKLYSRNGTNLTPLFTDLAPVLAARLPADLVLDGELVVWDTAAGKLDFTSLQARMTAGRRIRSIAAQQPAQFVASDVLAADSEDLRDQPLKHRRAVLERALSGLASPIVLCQQTYDVATAREWLRTLTAGGIEGLVIKDAAGAYPTQAGQRGGKSRPRPPWTCWLSASPAPRHGRPRLECKTRSTSLAGTTLRCHAEVPAQLDSGSWKSRWVRVSASAAADAVVVVVARAHPRDPGPYATHDPLPAISLRERSQLHGFVGSVSVPSPCNSAGSSWGLVSRSRRQ